jgi:hypothetical protein
MDKPIRIYRPGNRIAICGKTYIIAITGHYKASLICEDYRTHWGGLFDIADYQKITHEELNKAIQHLEGLELITFTLLPDSTDQMV